MQIINKNIIILNQNIFTSQLNLHISKDKIWPNMIIHLHSMFGCFLILSKDIPTCHYPYCQRGIGELGVWESSTNSWLPKFVSSTVKSTKKRIMKMELHSKKTVINKKVFLIHLWIKKHIIWNPMSTLWWFMQATSVCCISILSLLLSLSLVVYFS